jgi:hypothetical protein
LKQCLDPGQERAAVVSVASSVMRAKSFRVASPREVGFDNFELVAYRV